MCVIPSHDCDKIPEAINFGREEVSIGRSVVGWSYRFELLARSRERQRTHLVKGKEGGKTRLHPR